MNTAKRILMVVLIAGVITIALPGDAIAQYPVTVQPVVPTVVGYTAERRGFFGQRVVLRPVVANVPAAPAVAVERTVTVARPAVEPVAAYYPPPTVTVARPAVAPVAAYHAPPVARVSAYYAPTVARVSAYYAPPVAPVVTTYRVPVVTTYRIPVVTTYRIAY